MIEGRSAIPPLVVELVVAATPERAFSTWVELTELWWPGGDTVSGDPSAIVFEPRVGGRIYERARDGAEHEWGEVIVWDPPVRVEYSWHLFFPADEATFVAVTFTQQAGSTLVRIEQTGWDALGESGPLRRDRTTRGWGTVGEAYRGFVEREGG